MKKVAGIVIALAVIFAFKMYNRADADQQVKADAKEAITQLDFYDANAEYIDAMFERYHSTCFDAAYTMGGRRTRDKFDVNKYLAELFDRMGKQARDDNKRELATQLFAAAEGAKASAEK